jgi:7,8-dihydro-6-hydroxymethylpterin-pyrophosphokinase
MLKQITVYYRDYTDEKQKVDIVLCEDYDFDNEFLKCELVKKANEKELTNRAFLIIPALEINKILVEYIEDSKEAVNQVLREIEKMPPFEIK